MGDEQKHSAHGAAAAPLPYRLTAEFREPPALFEGCFTTFYHLTLEVDEPGLVLRDQFTARNGPTSLLPAAALPEARIASHALRAQQFVATGPSSLPCQFARPGADGRGILPLGLGAVFGEDAGACANLVCDGATHSAFAHFPG